MGALKDGWDNIKQGLVAAWTGLTPENRAFFSGMAIGAACVGLLCLLF